MKNIMLLLLALVFPLTSMAQIISTPMVIQGTNLVPLYPIAYTPSVSANWSPVPSDTSSALDNLAANKQSTIAIDSGTAHQFFKSYSGGVFGKSAIGLTDLPSIQYPVQFWADGVAGNDSTGDGSRQRPWLTLSHACASISTTIPNPVMIHLTGASDVSPSAISCPANIILNADDPQYQISQAVTIVGTAGNDTFGAISITFLAGLNFVKNDSMVQSIFLNNVDVISGPVLKQNGSGGFNIFANNLIANGLDVKTGPSGLAIFNNPYFVGTTTFEDAASSAYYQFQGGYIVGSMSIAGGPFVYFSGLMFDVPGGGSLTTTSTGNGSPTIQTDSSSVPSSISGPNTLQPTTFTYQTALAGQPACSASNRGLQWLVQGGAGVADLFQICQKNAADAYVWTTH